ncbi:LIM and SH3 domain protein 1-like isoform X2 [Hydractinia symbiolongicarpus]|uniref:LIM and SH3 domain protein 1-like isoform X2 n=1 Tax=Hydractinia symbiolongicarpus TaxID=13093 RepID=UPI0025503739|nr:LIM and SH3 domain protein 1-like isoform X2 [Hydractinia symbiolongicarpus]
MNAKCHRCNKTVYPVEKLSCLDKTWHKGCFNCETCHMTLSMKTYKGYNKLPYCNTHYPTTKFTAVADTPENLRLKKNTTNQSNVVYHKDFEQERGKFTAVADDPETLRVKKSQVQASDVRYQQKVAGDAPATRYDAPRSPPAQSYQPPPPAQSYDPPPPAQTYEPEPQPDVPTPSGGGGGGGGRFVALYDYTAADDDEVSFNENDVIINGEAIDDGWMTGTVERTGETGMLPSNYVDPQ